MRTETVKGLAEIRDLLSSLTSDLGVRAAFVCRRARGAEDRAETLALFLDGEFLENRNYPLAGTPCARVYERGIVYHSHALSRIYPDDSLLAEWGVDSYLGVGVEGQDGEPIGHIGVMHDREFAHPAVVETAVRLVAHHVAELI